MLETRLRCETQDFQKPAELIQLPTSSENSKEKHRVSDAEFLLDGRGYLTALARTDLSGDLNYTERNIVEKMFQTFTMRIGRFHETWNDSQASAKHWLTAYTAYYNHFRSHQALDNEPPIKIVK